MRTSCGPIDSAKLPWVDINEALSCKILNGNREEGAHTLILRSKPRKPNPPRGQYHPANEEFFCLGGDFTFDGSTWLQPNSYVFYPAHFVHGTKVHVRGGYEVYLRISGTSAIHWEESPLSDRPYVAKGHTSDDFVVQTRDAVEQLAGCADVRKDNGQIGHEISLHSHPLSKAGSTLVAMGVPNGVGHTHAHFSSSDLLELFVLSGSFTTESGEVMGKGAYLCRAAAKAAMSLACTHPGMVMISHEGPLDTEFAGGQK